MINKAFPQIELKTVDFGMILPHKSDNCGSYVFNKYIV
ncbi:hypothetical protein EV144_104323 [Flavobacterium sp. 270]|nr:hypothetical protein EV144_104323 [Flavobacterium sp. 270]